MCIVLGYMYIKQTYLNSYFKIVVLGHKRPLLVWVQYSCHKRPLTGRPPPQKKIIMV